MGPGTWTYPALAATAMAGGAINAIAGGGTLLTFPSLLAVIHPVAANATSTVALLPGSLAGAWGYRSELNETKPMLRVLWLPSLIGGILGSLAVTRFPERVFEDLVPWLLVVASSLLLLQKPLMRWVGAHPHKKPHRGTVGTIIFFQFLVGLYGGYFGAGIGILMLSSLAFMGIPDIHRMNGLKSVLAALINGATAVIFVMEGVVVWKYAIVMAVASIIGGYLGARGARRLPAAYVRAIVVFIGFGVAAYTFYKRFAS
jgi:uncharacterized membrane protein YfcA